MKRTKVIRFLAVCGMLFAMFSCQNDNSTSPPPGDNTVDIRDNLFSPQNLTVTLGRPVLWRQQGSSQHTVTSGSPTNNPGGLFDSGLLAPGSGFQFTFNAPGTYNYFCRVHGIAMTGSI